VLKRAFTDNLLKKLRSFPAVAILGARQCGKTTFIRSVLKDWHYIDLERPSDKVPFSADPESRLIQLGTKVILDEAQQLPEIFPVLRSIIDEDRTVNGQYVLLGSASPTLIKSISESLAGRIAFLEMSPFLWREVRELEKAELSSLWFRGGFSDAFLAQDNSVRSDWYEGYTRTFIERDLAALGIDVSGPQMRRLWTMLAYTNANLWNASQLASSLGVTYKTINRYTDILEQTFLVRKLQPYFANIGKRLVKSPKILLRDTGLLHYFLGIDKPEILDTHPGRGASWESFLIEQLIMSLSLKFPGLRFYHWRTAGGTEVDLIIESSGVCIPVEIKLHSAPSRSLVRGIAACMKDLQLNNGFVLYPGKKSYSLGEGIMVLPAEEVLVNPEILLGNT